MGKLQVTAIRIPSRHRQANQLAQGAAAVAAQGGEVVGKVVATMQAVLKLSQHEGAVSAADVAAPASRS